jgi:hypothetical protein
MENKRGDIPTTILVIGTIVVCCIALFSFYSSTIQIRSSFTGLGMMEKINSQIENKTFYQEDPAGLYLEKNMTTGFFGLGKQEILFSVEFKP